MLKNFKIYTKMMVITLWLFPKVIAFPKKQRFVLGQQIENSTLTILRLIIQANNAPVPQAKLAYLDSLNTELEILRSLLRVAYELKFMTAPSLGYITAQIDEVGRMYGGWAKRYRSE